MLLVWRMYQIRGRRDSRQGDHLKECYYTIIQVKYNEELMARTVVVVERRDKLRAGMCPP